MRWETTLYRQKRHIWSYYHATTYRHLLLLPERRDYFSKTLKEGWRWRDRDIDMLSARRREERELEKSATEACCCYAMPCCWESATPMMRYHTAARHYDSLHLFIYLYMRARKSDITSDDDECYDDYCCLHQDFHFHLLSDTLPARWDADAAMLLSSFRFYRDDRDTLMMKRRQIW